MSRRAHRPRKECARLFSMWRDTTGCALTVSTVCHSELNRRRIALARCHFRSGRDCPAFRRNEIILHWEFRLCENRPFFVSVSRQYCANVFTRGRIGGAWTANVPYQGPHAAAAPASGAASYGLRREMTGPAGERMQEIEALRAGHRGERPAGRPPARTPRGSAGSPPAQPET